MNQLWDAQYTLAEKTALYQTLEGKVVDLCTVRSPSVREASAGTLFWLALAGNIAPYAQAVNVYDFETGNDEYGSGVPAVDIARTLRLPSNVNIHRAEEQVSDKAWQMLAELSNGDLPSGIHPHVRKALDQDVSIRPSNLYRMAEELSVFISGYDNDHVQLSAHEHETVSLVRAVLPDIAKKYIRIDTGIAGSEFRRKRVGSIEGLAHRALGQVDGTDYAGFCKETLQLVYDALRLHAEREHPLGDLREQWKKDAEESGYFYDCRIRFGSERAEDKAYLDDVSFGNFASARKYSSLEKKLGIIVSQAKLLHPDIASFMPVFHRVDTSLAQIYIPEYDTEAAFDLVKRSLGHDRPDFECLLRILDFAQERIPSDIATPLTDAMMASGFETHEDFRSGYLQGTLSLLEKQRMFRALKSDEKEEVKKIRRARVEERRIRNLLESPDFGSRDYGVQELEALRSIDDSRLPQGLQARWREKIEEINEDVKRTLEEKTEQDKNAHWTDELESVPDDPLQAQYGNWDE